MDLQDAELPTPCLVITLIDVSEAPFYRPQSFKLWRPPLRVSGSSGWLPQFGPYQNAAPEACFV